jgi:hypothetical protein
MDSRNGNDTLLLGDLLPKATKEVLALLTASFPYIAFEELHCIPITIMELYVTSLSIYLCVYVCICVFVLIVGLFVVAFV